MTNPKLRDALAERLRAIVDEMSLKLSDKEWYDTIASRLLESVPGEEPLAWEIEREILGGTAPALGQVSLIHPPKRSVRVARFLRSKILGWVG